MKLLFSAYACDPTQGSEPGSGWNWVYHTAKSGHEVWCMTRVANQKNIENWLMKYPVTNLHLVYVPVPRWLEYLGTRHPRPAVYLHYLRWQYRAYRVARKLHAEEPFDLVHHVSYGSLQLGSHLWKLNIPFVFGPIGGAQQVPRQYRQYLAKEQLWERLRSLTSRLLLYRRGNTRRAIQHAYLVLATNQETYDLARQLGAARVELQLDNGIADNFFPPQFPERTKEGRLQILWIGRLVANKGLSLVLDAFGRLKPRYPIHLTVVGNGPLEKHYRQQVAQAGLGERISFRGRIPFAEIKALYRGCDVLVYTGLRNTFGIQILEAMSFGLPVVTLNLHGVRTFVPDTTGIKVEPTDVERTVEQIKQALLQLYLDPDQRRTFGRNAYHYARQHTWSAKVAEVNQAYPVDLRQPTD